MLNTARSNVNFFYPSESIICGYQPRHAVVMGWFQEETPLPGRNGRLTYEVDFCPRTILRRVVESSSGYLPLPLPLPLFPNFSPLFLLLLIKKHPSRKAKNELNLSFLIGVESEFILLKQTNPIEAVNNYGWSNSPA